MSPPADPPGHRRGALALVEFRALAGAGLLSVVGDQVARVALSVLVFDRTSSALLTALTYAMTFLPAVIGGPLLAGLADRRPRRELMVTADAVRAVLVVAMAFPPLPLPVLVAMVVVVNALGSPFDAARAALVPDVTGARYLSALAVDRTLQQAGQVVGFAGSGLLLLAVGPHAALLVDAASFAASAVLLRRWVSSRPAAAATSPAIGPAIGPADDLATGPATGGGRRRRQGWGPPVRRALGDARFGLASIWSDRAVRRAVLLTWVVVAAAVVPEGLAAPFARQLGGGSVLVALILAANPTGNVLAALSVSRWSPRGAERLLAPLSQLALLPLAVCVLRPSAAVVIGLVAVSGVGMTASLLAQTVFVAHVPADVRGRAFGVAAAGITVGQGLAIAGAGAAAAVLAPSTVVGGAGLLGAVAAVAVAVATRGRQARVAAPAPVAPVT